MFKELRGLIKDIWPILECLILSTLIGYKYDHFLSTVIVVFIFMIVINYVYKQGYWIRYLGWGVYGLLLGTQFYLLLNGILCLIFILVRFLLGKVFKN